MYFAGLSCSSNDLEENIPHKPPSKAHSSLLMLASKIRPKLSDTGFSCVTVTDELYGSYNVVYIIEFNDKKKFVFRVPIDTNNGHLSDTAKRSMISQVGTMQFIRRNTTIPLPEIYAFNTSMDDTIGTPYVAMSFIEGEPVYSVWFDDVGPTTREERRQRILRSIARAMVQLEAFSFDKIGSLVFTDASTTVGVAIGPCYGWTAKHSTPSDYSKQHRLAPHITQDDGNKLCTKCGISTGSRIISGVPLVKSDEQFFCFEGVKQNLCLEEIGPFESSKEYLTAVIRVLGGDSNLPIPQATRTVLQAIIDCLTSPAQDSETETFVLAPPDFNSQNVMVDEKGNVTGFIDWDNVHTVPREIGCCRYPGWITRDWDLINYQHNGFDPLEDSPHLLKRYRTMYGQMIKRLLGPEQDQVIRQSLVFGTIEKAAYHIKQGAIVRNLLRKALSVSLKESYCLIPDVEEWSDETKEQLRNGVQKLLKGSM